MHTPGSWKIAVGYVLSADGQTVADVLTCAGSEENADIRLIAAAPDLLAALEGLKCWDCEYPLTHPDYAGCYSCKLARSAIALAKEAP